MKRTLIVALVFILGSSATFAGGRKGAILHQSTKTITLNSSFNKVTVGENLKVVFTSQAGLDVSISGDQKFVDGVNLQVKDGILVIDAKAGVNHLTGTIYLPANNLTLIEAKADSKISSNGFLNSRNLTIVINEGSRVELKNKGTLTFKSESGTTLDFEKYQSIQE